MAIERLQGETGYIYASTANNNSNNDDNKDGRENSYALSMQMHTAPWTLKSNDEWSERMKRISQVLKSKRSSQTAENAKNK